MDYYNPKPCVQIILTSFCKWEFDFSSAKTPVTSIACWHELYICICMSAWLPYLNIPCTAPDHGSCNVPDECVCDEGYTGEFCDEDSDVCSHQQPCAVGSTCTNTGPDQYACFCATGFTGQNCDTEINECLPDPCLNGATCFVSRFVIHSFFQVKITHNIEFYPPATQKIEQEKV